MSKRRFQQCSGVSSANSGGNELAEGHFSLVACIARDIYRTLPASVPLDDLIGAGNVGLVEAGRRFDPDNGASFTTFARHRIRGAITDSLRQLDPVPRSLRIQQKQAERATAMLAVKLGRPPSEAETAECLLITIGKWRAIRRQLFEAGCTTEPFARGAVGSISSDSVAGTWLCPRRFTEIAELRRLLNRALRVLPLRHRKIILLNHFENWPMKRIGAALGVNESRVSQIRASALALLRTELARVGFEAKRG